MIQKREESIQLLDELIKSTFLDMFGDPILNQKGFIIKYLKEFYVSPKAGTKCGPFGSALKKGEFIAAGIPVWNMDNISKDGRFIENIKLWITDEKYQDLLGFAVQNDDIIISRAGTVGKMCVINSKFPKSIISTNLIRFRLNVLKLLPIYFVSLMTYCKERVGRLKTGNDGALTHMNTGILDSIKFPYHPKKLQNKFASIVTKIEATKAKYQTSLEELKNLFNATAQKAFKGELNLGNIEVIEEEIQVLDEDKVLQLIQSGNFEAKDHVNKKQSYDAIRDMVLKLMDKGKITQKFTANKKMILEAIN